jgi:hypothetical protein
VTETPKEIDLETRNINEFWAVWHEGMEWPQLLYSESMARERAHVLAKSCIGVTVHLLKFNIVGTACYPSEPKLTGQLRMA